MRLFGQIILVCSLGAPVLSWGDGVTSMFSKLSERGREFMQEFELERSAAQVVTTTSRSGRLRLLMALRAANGRDMVVKRLDMRDDGSLVRTTFKLPEAELPSEEIELVERATRRGDNLIRVVHLKPKSPLGLKTFDTYAVQEVGRRKLRILREHADAQSRFVVQGNELWVFDPAWRSYRHDAPDEIIVNAVAQTKGFVLTTYNKSNDTFAETTLGYDWRSNRLDTMSTGSRAVSLEEANQAGLIAKVEQIPGMKKIDPNVPPEGMRVEGPTEP